MGKGKFSKSTSNIKPKTSSKKSGDVYKRMDDIARMKQLTAWKSMGTDELARELKKIDEDFRASKVPEGHGLQLSSKAIQDKYWKEFLKYVAMKVPINLSVEVYEELESENYHTINKALLELDKYTYKFEMARFIKRLDDIDVDGYDFPTLGTPNYELGQLRDLKRDIKDSPVFNKDQIEDLVEYVDNAEERFMQYLHEYEQDSEKEMYREREKRYFYKYAGATQPYDTYAKSMQDAVQSLYDNERVPDGFEIWEASSNQSLGDTSIMD